jgi:tetratricopeptide (TPR) repeat protein
VIYSIDNINIRGAGNILVQPSEVSEGTAREWECVYPRLDKVAYDRFHAVLDEFHDAGLFAESRKRLILILNDYPEFIDAAHHIALSYYRTGDKPKAAELWERMMAEIRTAIPSDFSPGHDVLPWVNFENRPVLRVMHGLSLARLDLKDYAGALSLLEELAAFDPAGAHVMQCLYGMLYLCLGRPEDVLRLYGSMKVSESPEVAFSIALAYFQTGDTKKGSSALLDAAMLFPLIAKELSKRKATDRSGAVSGTPIPTPQEEAYEFRERYWEMWKSVPAAKKSLRMINGALKIAKQNLKEAQSMHTGRKTIGYRSPAAVKARAILFHANDSDDVDVLVKAAKKALKVYPSCTEAFVDLAEYDSKSYKEEFEYYRKAIESADIDLGPDFRDTYKGGFWGVMETRPYMRALDGMAMCLWEMGREEESIEVYRTLYKLNENDNQGIRYVLIGKLMALGKWAEAERFIHSIGEEEEATFMYSRALILFHKPGKKVQAQDALTKAFRYNPFVPFYLFGERNMPDEMPPFVTSGGDDEAITYIADAVEAWGNDPGAIRWGHQIFMRMKDALAALVHARKEDDRRRNDMIRSRMSPAPEADDPF